MVVFHIVIISTSPRANVLRRKSLMLRLGARERETSSLPSTKRLLQIDFKPFICQAAFYDMNE